MVYRKKIKYPISKDIKICKLYKKPMKLTFANTTNGWNYSVMLTKLQYFLKVSKYISSQQNISNVHITRGGLNSNS